MRRAGLPVPVPIAACYRRIGRYSYTRRPADRADSGRELAGRAPATRAPLPLTDWIAIGRCLRRFHDDGVCHADLNAHNVLLDEAQAVWLVDFDRGALRRPGLWCDGNLVRLRRSLEKITDRLPPERFSEADWASLLERLFRRSRKPPPPEDARRPAVRRLYTLLLYLALPVGDAASCWRAAGATREYWRGWRAAFRLRARLARAAASGCTRYRSGEVQVAAVLIEALRAARLQTRDHADLRDAHRRARARAHCCPASRCATRPTICRAACAAAWRACARGC